MTITATFSNGFVDTYKGKRPVKAAWMIILPNGEIMSGHSLDRAKAETTARGNAALASGFPNLISEKDARYAHTLAWANREAKAAGFADFRAFNASQAAKRNAFIAACKFEFIDL